VMPLKDKSLLRKYEAFIFWFGGANEVEQLERMLHFIIYATLKS